MKKKTIKTENVQKLVRKLKRKRDRMTLSLYKNVYRLKKHFRLLIQKEITEILNKKIQIRKKIKKYLKLNKYFVYNKSKK